MANPFLVGPPKGHHVLMTDKQASNATLDFVLPSKAVGVPAPVPAKTEFDTDSTVYFQAKMKNAPVWFCSFATSNT